MKKEILGVRFDALTMDEAADAAGRLLAEKRGGFIVTANPEILLEARKDEAYRAVLNGADLTFCDGIGVILAGRILGTAVPERVTGSDLTPRLLERLAAEGGSVFLYGAKPGVAEKAAVNLLTDYPGLRIAGTENGYISDDADLLRRLEKTKPDLILAGLGAPKQERWMAAHRRDTDAVMIGVGGLLDVFAGNVPRAPVIWRRLGLEWLYRTAREPRRITRVIRLPLILLAALRERIRSGKKDTGPKTAVK